MYGYYVLPLLVGDRFVGRADLKADRARGRAPDQALHARAGRARRRRRAARARRHAARARPRTRRCRAREVSVEEARRIAVAQRLDGSRPTCSTVGASASCSSIRSAVARRSISCSGAGSAGLRPPSSTTCSGTTTAVEWTRSSGRRGLPLCARGCARRTARGSGTRVPERTPRSAATSCASSSSAARSSRARSRRPPDGPRGAPLVGRAQDRADARRARRDAARSPSSGAAEAARCGISPSAGTPRPSACRGQRRSGRLEAKRLRSLGVELRARRVWSPIRTRSDEPVPGRVTFLSPFDRLDPRPQPRAALWDFFYRLEMYVPKAKREYGYYVLPILRGDRVVGRIEPSRPQAGVLRVLGTGGSGRAYAVDRRCRTWRAGSDANSSSMRDGVRDARDPRRAGARPRDRRDHHADLPDLHVRAGGGRRAQGLRLLARREPDAHRARRSRSRASRTRAHGIAFSSGLGATTTLMHLVDPGERVVLIADVYGGVYRMTSQVYEPKGYKFTYVPAERVRREPRRRTSTTTCAWSGSRRRRTRC